MNSFGTYGGHGLGHGYVTAPVYTSPNHHYYYYYYGRQLAHPMDTPMTTPPVSQFRYTSTPMVTTGPVFKSEPVYSVEPVYRPERLFSAQPMVKSEPPMSPKTSHCSEDTELKSDVMDDEWVKRKVRDRHERELREAIEVSIANTRVVRNPASDAFISYYRPSICGRLNRGYEQRVTFWPRKSPFVTKAGTYVVR